MADDLHALAESDFYKARSKAISASIFGMLRPSMSDLMPFDQAKELLKPRAETYRGVTAVPIDRIVGSEGRYRDFNRFFFPKKEHLKARWTTIDELQYKDVSLPPVVLYEMGGVFFVRDGNHRVSVARAKKQEFIDAEVISLHSEIQLDPEMTIEDIKKAVIEYEKKQFYRETNYPNIVGADDLNFSEPGRFDSIKEHVLVHKYFLNQHLPEEIPFHIALYSWHDNVYQPISQSIEAENILSLFPGRTVSDLYLFLVAHWDELKRKSGGYVAIDEAAESFKNEIKRNRNSSFEHACRIFGSISKKVENFIAKL